MAFGLLAKSRSGAGRGVVTGCLAVTNVIDFGVVAGGLRGRGAAT